MELEENLDIRKRSRSSFFALVVRSGIIHLFQAVSIFLLARWLNPDDYGLYGIINSWIALSYYFCDIGIGGALVQQEREPTKEQLQLCFTTQMSLSLGLCAVFWVVSNSLAAYHSLDVSGLWMIRVLALAIPIYALRGIPKIHFERKIEFKPLAKIELAESFCMYVVQITLAYFQFAAWSFILANLTRAIVGTTLLFIKHPKFYLPKFFKKEFWKLAKFGIPFQLNAIVPSLKVLIIPVIVASFLDLDSIGIITWTAALATIPTILSINYNQVFFPSLSRLQGDKDALRDLASRGMELAVLGFGFIFGAFAVCSSPGIDFFFPDKWDLAKQLFPLAIVLQVFMILSYLCSSILNATGRPATRLGIEAVSTVGEFLFCWIGVYYYFEFGYFYGRIVVCILSTIYTFIKVKDSLRWFTFVRILKVFIVCVLGYVILPHISDNLFVRFGSVFLFYIVGISLIDRGSFMDILWIVKSIKATLDKRKKVTT